MLAGWQTRRLEACATNGRSTGKFRPDSAIRYVGAHLLLWTTASLALAADLWTKHWAFTALGRDESRLGWFGLVMYQRSLNDGALFGLGKGLVPLFIVASVLAVGFILYFFACSHYKQRLLHLALAFVLAGALGNMFDRMWLRADRVKLNSETGEPKRLLGVVVGDPSADPIRIGSWPDGADPQPYARKALAELPRSLGIVRDFIKIRVQIAGHDVWPWVFNLADTLLVVGVAMLFIGFAFEHRTVAKGTPSGLPTTP
ncbi:MAG: signal peptidase II [Planctomycetota bacterium]